MPTQKIFLYFPECQTDTPVVYHLVKDYDLMVNIFRAKINAKDEGYLVLNLTGEREKIDRAIEYIRASNVEVRINEKGVYWDETKCTGCSNCLTHCPTQALYMRDRTSMEIAFNADKCVECLSCIDNCPYGACSSLF
jgi:ferredoxin